MCFDGCDQPGCVACLEDERASEAETYRENVLGTIDQAISTKAPGWIDGEVDDQGDNVVVSISIEDDAPLEGVCERIARDLERLAAGLRLRAERAGIN